MKKLSVLVIAAFIGASFMMHSDYAEANTCMRIVKQAQKALNKKKNLPAEKAAEIKQLINTAKLNHKTGKHAQATSGAEQALKMLGQ